MTIGFNDTFSVLFVDDEDQTRKYFRMAFEQHFRVLTAGSVEEAWNLLSSESARVAVLITDQRMPVQVGTELLARVRREHPDIVRILTTAYADLDAVIDAVNSGAIYRYVIKPWDVRELRVTLTRAMEYFQLRRERDILLREKLSSLQQLLVADRIRSFAVLAEGLSSHVRDTMIALSAYVEIARGQLENRAPEAGRRAHQSFVDVHAEVERAHEDMLKLIHSVAEATTERRYEFGDRIGLSEILHAAWAQAAGPAKETIPAAKIEVAPNLPELAGSRSMLQRMLANLIRHVMIGTMAEQGGGKRAVQIDARTTTRLWGADSVAIEIVCPGFAWSESSLASLFLPPSMLDNAAGQPDLLVAFFIAYHHGGTLAVHNDGPAAGFRLTLPFRPEAVTRPALDHDAVADLFLRLPRWDALERGA
jgi:two-component system probable response regulator PhcQ